MLARYCEYCGKDIQNTAVFCPYCGSNPIAVSLAPAKSTDWVLHKQKSVA